MNKPSPKYIFQLSSVSMINRISGNYCASTAWVIHELQKQFVGATQKIMPGWLPLPRLLRNTAQHCSPLDTSLRNHTLRMKSMQVNQDTFSLNRGGESTRLMTA